MTNVTQITFTDRELLLVAAAIDLLIDVYVGDRDALAHTLAIVRGASAHHLYGPDDAEVLQRKLMAWADQLDADPERMAALRRGRD